MNDDHQKWAENVIGIVRGEIQDAGSVAFSVFTIDEDGKRGRLSVDPILFQNGAAKERLRRKLRTALREARVVRYATVGECWVWKQPPIGSMPVNRDDLDDYVARFLAEYERRGWSPQHGGGREEVVFVNVCDRQSASLFLWRIVRGGQEGHQVELVPHEYGASMSLIAGRFINLLEGQVH